MAQKKKKKVSKKIVKKGAKKKVSSKKSSRISREGLNADQEEFIDALGDKEAKAVCDVLDIQIDEIDKFDRDRDFGIETYRLEAGNMEWLGFADQDDAERYAVNMVKQDLEYEPEIFNQDFLEKHITITDTDMRLIAQEEADDLVENVYSDDDILREADMEEAYEEEEDDSKKDSILEEAREKVREDKYEEIKEQLEDPVEYFVKDRGIYSIEDLMKASFISIDTDGAAEEAVGVDGVAHFLARYDGHEQSADKSVWYRVN